MARSHTCEPMPQASRADETPTPVGDVLPGHPNGCQRLGLRCLGSFIDFVRLTTQANSREPTASNNSKQLTGKRATVCLRAAASKRSPRNNLCTAPQLCLDKHMSCAIGCPFLVADSVTLRDSREPTLADPKDPFVGHLFSPIALPCASTQRTGRAGSAQAWVQLWQEISTTWNSSPRN